MRHSLIASCVVLFVVPALSAPAFAARHPHGYRHAVGRHAMTVQADDTRHYYYDYAPTTELRQNRQSGWQQNDWGSAYWSQSNLYQGNSRSRSGFGQQNFGQQNFGQQNLGQQNFGQGYGELDGMASAQASANGIPASLVERVIKRESGGNPRAVSAGNYGLMQIRLGTARAMGFSGSASDLLDPQVNMTYAVRYLAGAYRAAGGNENRAVALYASGYSSQAKAQGVSPYASETSGFGAYRPVGFNNAEAYGNPAPVYRVRHYRRRA
jgi:soluble lytic murein transglycosylase-like protein